MNDNKNKYPIGELPQSASQSSQVVDELAEKKREQKKSLIKVGAMLVLSIIMLIFSSLSWFTNNRSVEGSGMQIKAGGMPFELKTSGTTALYQTRTNEIFPNAPSASTTSGGNSSISWLVNQGSNINNYKDSDKTLKEITKIDSSDYGLGPGSNGILKFTVVPTNPDAQLNLRFTTVLKGYSADYDDDGYEIDTKALTDISDENINRYLNGHILFFYEFRDGSDTNIVMIENNEFEMSFTGETEVTLYWVWPETLRNILNRNITGLDDSSAQNEIRKLLFAHPEIFLERTGTPSDSSKPYDEISIASLTDENISSVSEDILTTTKKYEKYSGWYNNADQTLGDSVSYVSFELTAELNNSIE
ncbi:hypothetical protein [Ruminococcus flavefaciens]|uniref:hypothetical protein n=1 Tax=Ruminococcus flavefaciens TaxID=1265 RepID=UPI0026EA4B1E|nr:hypothetical protein [Ruminococcus flavefaciens]MDD7518164.1 hypothetical protein [Ruminococcus flavefaciens]MDY5690476.1 hypothetical protein [Ruminococcus flavefaciens]